MLLTLFKCLFVSLNVIKAWASIMIHGMM